MRYSRKAVTVIQKGEVEYCSCSHNSSLHDSNGCTGLVVRFACAPRPVSRNPNMRWLGYDGGHDHVKECIFKVRCSCRFTGNNTTPKSGTVVLESEKE